MSTSWTYNFFGWKFDFSPVAFTIPGVDIQVRWYGIMITLGFVLAVIYALKKAKSFGVNSDRLMDCILVTAPLSILGARAYYILFNPEVSFSEFFTGFTNGGLAIYGAVIAAAIVGTLMCKLRKVDVLSTLDLTVAGFFIGQAFGRWGNFFNQEAYGKCTNSTWFGISGTNIISDTNDSLYMYHPCFLYESIWCALGFLVLHILSKKRKFKGEMVCVYMMWYGFGRFFIEYFRTDSLYFGSTVKVSMLLSGVIMLVGLVLLVIGLKRAKDPTLSNKYTPVFEEVNDTNYDEFKDLSDVDEKDVKDLEKLDGVDETENIKENDNGSTNN